MNHGSLFSGIGGFDLAAQWMGWDNKFHCEWNEFGQKVLKHYWPEAASYEDINTTDFTIHRGRIDILSGGFPCQPYSQAGKRLGKEDDRHLWPEMLRAIREIQPRWVVGENVRGLTNWNGGMVFDEVQTDLENEGYEVTPFLLPACAVNAPHRRDRIWFVAHATGDGHELRRPREGGREKGESESVKEQRERIRNDSGRTGEQRDASNSESSSGERELQQRQREGESGGRNSGNHVTNPNVRRQSSEEHGEKKPGRAAEAGAPNYWENFPTQPPICDRNDGLSNRLDTKTILKAVGRKVNKLFKPLNWWKNETIKAGGNAIVPQVAHQIFKAIQQYENENN